MAANNQGKKPAAKTAAAAAPKPKRATVKPKPAPARPKPTAPKAQAAVAKPQPAPSPVNGMAGKAGIKAAAKPSAPPKEKIKKPKLVRDSFTMPEAEYAALGAVKKACLKAGFEVKKSELLRVGVALIRDMETARLKTVLATLPPLKAGRPKKDK